MGRFLEAFSDETKTTSRTFFREELTSVRKNTFVLGWDPERSRGKKKNPKAHPVARAHC